jgi:hypothetical protein
MNDRNLRISRLLEQIRQRDPGDQGSAGHPRRAAAADRLKRTAARTRARVAEAEARLLPK